MSLRHKPSSPFLAEPVLSLPKERGSGGWSSRLVGIQHSVRARALVLGDLEDVTMRLTEHQMRFFETFGFLKFPGLLAAEIDSIIEDFEEVWAAQGGGNRIRRGESDGPQSA